MTNANGKYEIVVPVGPTLTYLVQPTAGLPVGSWTATTPVPQGVPPLQAGQKYLDADFGYDSNTLLGVIGNQVWREVVVDGIYDANGADNIAGNADDEPGIPGVSVDLWRDPDAVPTWDGDETIVATTTTDTLGQYTFQGVPAGNYFVMVSDTANVLTDYKPSPVTVGPSPTDNLNRAQPYPVTLTAGNLTNNTADFGYIWNTDRPNRAVIGNQLWYETGSSINGLYEPGRGDIGIEGITMELLGANDALLATQVTGPSGDYAFTSLAAGTYKVRVGSSVTYPANGAILAGYKPTVPGPTQGADNNHQVPQPYTIDAGGQRHQHHGGLRLHRHSAGGDRRPGVVRHGS